MVKWISRQSSELLFQVQVLVGAQALINLNFFRFMACARRSDVLPVGKTASRGRENFERRREIICDHKDGKSKLLRKILIILYLLFKILFVSRETYINI